MISPPAPEYATSASRLTNRDALNAEIERITLRRTSAEWVEAINAAGVPCGPIYTIDEVFEDPQVEHLHAAQGVRLQNGKAIDLLAQPFSLSRTPSALPPRRRCLASTPRRFSPSSALARTRSPACARQR